MLNSQPGKEVEVIRGTGSAPKFNLVGSYISCITSCFFKGFKNCAYSVRQVTYRPDLMLLPVFSVKQEVAVC